jgi:hypothetical protein
MSGGRTRRTGAAQILRKANSEFDGSLCYGIDEAGLWESRMLLTRRPLRLDAGRG